MASFGRVFVRNFKTSANLNAGANYNENAAKGAVLWKNMSIFVAIPAVIVCSINSYISHNSHEHPERPEFLNYEYMRVRRSKYPWGDGNHTLFHNKHVNALPEVGYEE